jgi:hypothetical protein
MPLGLFGTYRYGPDDIAVISGPAYDEFLEVFSDHDGGMFIELFRLDQPIDGPRLEQYRNGRKRFFSSLSPKQQHAWMKLIIEMKEFRLGPGPDALKRYGPSPLIYPPILLSLLEEAMRAYSGSGTQTKSVYFAFSLFT